MQWVVVINSKLVLVSLTGLMLLASCEERISQGDRLSADELTYLRERAALQCLSLSNKTYENIEKASNDNMLSFVRGNTWKYEYKIDNTIIGSKTSHIYVWKVSPPHVYFRMKLSDDGGIKNRFLKVDTLTNIDMFRNLQEKTCGKTLNATGSSPLNVKLEVLNQREDADTVSDTTTDYKISSLYPAYFGAINYKKTKKTYNNDDVLQKTEVFEYIFTRISDTTQPASYDDNVNIPNREFCVVKYADPTPPKTRDEYAFPFELECKTSGTVDGNGDGTPDFDPAAEL